MTRPAKMAPIAKKQLTDIRTNQVNSKPSNVVVLLSVKRKPNIQISIKFNLNASNVCDWLSATYFGINFHQNYRHLMRKMNILEDFSAF